VVSGLVLVGALIPGVTSGAPPTIERIPVDDTFVDDVLSEECGVAVTTSAPRRTMGCSGSGTSART
jgi:hypothetical protein